MSKRNKTYAEKKASGKCPVCGCRFPAEGRALCDSCRKTRNSQEHRDRQNKLIRLYKEKHRELGLCDRCSNPSVFGYKECVGCREAAIERRRNLKRQVINKYGGKCDCCSESYLEFLTIDHINGGGTKHRKELKNHYYKQLLDIPISSEYRVLCMNCNFSFGLYKHCPHELEKKSFLCA